ncbi:MAG: phospholipase D-like domain-containing protein [Bacteroidia bacterium]|nr:phospholipase D-like domain-containing protein [Bacteroidia bacterium]
MKHFLMLFLGLTVLKVNAQIPISQARASALNSTVTITGIVTNGNEFGTATRYIQDATGGIGTFSAAMMASTNRGDSVIVTGTLAQYNNLLQLSPVSNVQIISSGNPLPSPVVFPAGQTANAFAEAYEGMLVRLDGITNITTTAGGAVSSFAGNTNYNINGVAVTQMRANTNSTGATGVVGKTPPTSTFSLLGIMSQFCSSPTSGCTNGYQILPRLYADFILGAEPNIISKPFQTNITPYSFDIQFNTQNNGDTKIEYGLTLSLGSNTYDATQVTNHSLGLTGLTPATVYYVKVTSENSFGVSSSAIYPMMTASLSSGTIQTYFTRSVNNSYSTGTNAIQLPTTVDDTLIAYINRAKSTLDICIYNWNNTGLSDITQAVNNAYSRGVSVRVIADGSTSSTGLGTLNSAINKITSPQGTSPAGGFYGIMHNKFVVIDVATADPNDAFVWTGSTNWTKQQINTDFNNVIIFQDQSIARAYTMEFEEMWGSNTLTPNLTQGRFGNNKLDNTPHEFNINGKRVEVYFSPSDGTNEQILTALNNATSSFHFVNLVLSRTDVAGRVATKYPAMTCAEGIINDTSGATGAFFTMSNVMNNDLKIYTGSGLMHHKYLIVDKESAALDPLVLTGSHNWSNSAESRNDENTVIVHDLSIANQYFQEFAQRWIDNGGTNCITTNNNVSENTKQAVIVYPNPTEGNFTVSGNTTSNSISIVVYDIVGKKVFQNNYSTQPGEDYQISIENHLLSGVYQILIQDNQHTATAKLVVR